MTTVPVIQDSVALDTATGRHRLQGDPDAYGAAQARGIATVAQGVQAVADTASELDDHFNEANARELDNEYSARLRKELYDPEGGYLTAQRGRNAVDARTDVEGRIDAMAMEVAGQARNPRARAMAVEVMRRRAAAALGQVAEHAATQSRAYQSEQIETGLQEATDNAVAAYGDEPTVRANIQTGASMLQRAARLNGWSDETLASRQRQFQSDIIKRTIEQLAVTDPVAAEDLFTRERENMAAQDAGELRTTMRAAQAQARERLSGQIWQAIANGQNPRAIEAWREFSTNPLYGTEHVQVNDYLRARAEHAASGVADAALDRISRRTGDELLAIAADTRDGGPQRLDLIVRAAQGTLRVGNPMPRQARPDMTEGEFQAATGMSSARARGYYQRLRGDALREVLERVNSAETANSVETTTDRVLEYAEPYAQSAGVEIAGQSNAQRRARLRVYVYTRVRELLRSGTPIDQATRDQIARDAVAGSGASNRAFLDMRAYDEIPRNERNAIEQRMRARGQTPTPQLVEEAYARFLASDQ